MIWLMLTVVGLCLGSFVNALVWRIHDQWEIQKEGHSLTEKERVRLRKLSISQGRSMCLSCGHELAAQDLIPVLSWLSLRGKCRYCGAKIPDTPVAELLVPLVFVVSYYAWPYGLHSFSDKLLLCTWLLCAVAFVALSLYDLRWFILPDRIVFPLVGLSVGFVLFRVFGSSNPVTLLGGACLGVFVIAGLFYGLFVASNGKWIGGGDVKLGIALGLLAGGFIEGLLVILMASLFGLVVALPQIVGGKASGSTKIPFGPFLLLATLVTVLWGSHIVDWYVGLLTF